MTSLITAASIVLTLVASNSAVVVDAFSPAYISHNRQQHNICTKSIICTPPPPITQLQMSEGEESSADDTTATASEEEGEEEEEPVVEEKVLDPEVVALKEQITSLESDLSAKKSNLNNLKEMADKYSSAGYAREVAKGQNNKRLRSANMGNNKMAARASVLQTFLPVLDELDVVGKKYEGNSFASTLDSGLRSELQTSLNDLGVSEFNVEVGDTIDSGRVVAIEEVYSDEAKKGTVISVLKSGLEISGNAVRPAEVVGSLGSESDAAAAEEEQEESGEETEGDAE